MKSLAIKTNNSHAIEYLKVNLNKIELDNTYFSYKKFYHFTNIIIHYKGNKNEDFSNKLSTVLSFLVIYEFEEDILKRIIDLDYFYFSKYEKNKILDNCFNIIIESNTLMKEKFQTIYTDFSNHINNNKSLYLQGFVNFRLYKYFSILRKVVEEAVNSYILEKEYNEFISLLRLFIKTEPCLTNTLHIIYSKDYTLILDENKQIIDTPPNAFNAKFLSDISFSTNDYTLNTLLTLLPKKVYIHLIDNNKDEFLTTLSLIFESRLELCTDCNICNLYKHTKMLKR